MAILNVPDNTLARAIHVRQILNWLRGVPEYSEPVNFSGVNSGATYALTVANRNGAGDVSVGGGLGLGLAVKSSDLERTLFEVRHSGTVVRPNAAAQSIFRVLDINGTTVFEVTDTGITTGTASLITDSSTSTLTNKTITGGVLNSPRVADYLDIIKVAAPPAAPPAADRERLYSLVGESFLTYKDNAGTIKQMVDTASVQVLTGKTLTTPSITAPTITNPVVTGYVQLVQGAAPTNPGAGNLRLYARNQGGTSGLFYKSADDTEREIVDLNTTQILSNKTLGAGISLSTATLIAPYLNNYLEMERLVGTPGGAGGTRNRLWVGTDNYLHVTMPGGTDQIVFTNANATTIAGASFVRAAALGGL